ncbi:hypothetical protein [Dethiothermospora halolimnae]
MGLGWLRFLSDGVDKQRILFILNYKNDLYHIKLKNVDLENI